MYRILFVWGCCLASTISMTAQVALYPVYQQNKWGYISFWGDKTEVTIKPVYDFISPNVPWHSLINGFGRYESPFKLFEQNKKVGLLNNNLKEVLPARYQYIYPLTNRYFAVRTDSTLSLVRHNGVEVLKDRYDDIFALSTDAMHEIEYIIVTKDKKKGVFSVQEGLLFEPVFEEIALTKTPGLFKVKPAGGAVQDQIWGVADKKGDVILPCRYNDVRVLSQRLFVAQRLDSILNDSTKEYYYANRWKVVIDRVEQKEQYEKIEVLNNHWFNAYFSNKEVPALWSLDSIKMVETNKQKYSPLDGDYLVCTDTFNREWLVKNDLSLAIDGNFYTIDDVGLPGVFRVFYQGRLGLAKPSQSRELAIPLLYTRINDFIDSVAFVRKDGKWGAINFELDTIVPCIFTNLLRVNPRLLSGYVGEDSTIVKIIELDRLFRYKKATTLTKTVQSFSVLDDKLWYEATAKSLVEEPVMDPFDNWSWPMYYSWFNSGLLDSLEETLKKSAFLMVPDKVIGVVRKSKPLQIPYALTFHDNKAHRLLMYGMNGKQVAGSPTMAGCMPFQKDVPYTVFIDSVGLMGLVNREGQQRCDTLGVPLRFTYIGPFTCGVANVCVGGHLTFQPLPEKKIFSLGGMGTIDRIFGWSGAPSRSFTNDNHNYFVEKDKNSNPQWGAIDTLGRFVAEPRFDYVSPYYLPDSLARVGKYGAKETDPLLYGFMDQRGKVISPPKFESVKRYKGFYITENQGTSKYIFNKQGIFITRFETLPKVYLDSQKGFYEGLSPELDTNGRYGYLDSLGQFVLPGQYSKACNFSEGLAAVCFDSSEFWCFIDRTGKVAFQTIVPKKLPAARFPNNAKTALGAFKENRCYFRDNRKFGYYNHQGEQIIKPAFLSATNFSKGAATISSVDKLRNEVFGIVDSLGNILLQPSMKFKKIEPFKDHGTALAQIRLNNKYVFVGRIGEPITPLYDSIVDVTNGFAKVLLKDKWGLVNTRGNLIIPTEFFEIDTVSEGMVACQIEKKGDWTYFNTTGQKLPLEFVVEAPLFKDGYAQVLIRDTSTNNKSRAMIDKKGNILTVPDGTPLYYTDGVFVRKAGLITLTDKKGIDLIQKNYSMFQAVNPNLFLVGGSGNGWGAINRRGMSIIPNRYNRIIERSWYLIGFSTKLRGLVSLEGKELLPPEFELIEEMSDGILKVMRGTEIGYYDLKKGWRWPLQK